MTTFKSQAPPLLGIEITPVGIQRVIEFREPGFGEQRIGHTKTLWLTWRLPYG